MLEAPALVGAGGRLGDGESAPAVPTEKGLLRTTSPLLALSSGRDLPLLLLLFGDAPLALTRGEVEPVALCLTKVLIGSMAGPVVRLTASCIGVRLERRSAWSTGAPLSKNSLT